jgi:hypothetical protein
MRQRTAVIMKSPPPIKHCGCNEHNRTCRVSYPTSRHGMSAIRVSPCMCAEFSPAWVGNGCDKAQLRFGGRRVIARTGGVSRCGSARGMTDWGAEDGRHLFGRTTWDWRKAEVDCQREGFSLSFPKLAQRFGNAHPGETRLLTGSRRLRTPSPCAPVSHRNGVSPQPDPFPKRCADFGNESESRVRKHAARPHRPSS